MLMINIQGLNKIDQKYYYEGRVFTGVGFRVYGEKIEEVLSVEEGICVGQYRSKYFPNEELVNWGQESFQAAAKGVQEAFVKIKTKIEPYAGVLSSIGLAIANPGK